jgi:hypothetical protein
MADAKRPGEARAPRTPEETWEALEAAADEDEMDRILALTDEEVDAELAAEGFDPAAERARGAALARELLAARDRQAWQGPAHDKLEAARARFASRPPRRGKLPRADLLAQIERARNDPRFTGQATVMYRNRGGEEATDEELDALLTELEALADLVDAAKEKKST